MNIHAVALVFFLSLQVVFAQQQNTPDSVNVRVFNKGNYPITEYVLTIDGHDYLFTDIGKNEYSEYKKVPYLWPTNKSKITVLVKRFIARKQPVTILSWPFDHVNEKQYTEGNFVIEIFTTRSGRQFMLIDYVKKEKNPSL